MGRALLAAILLSFAFVAPVAAAPPSNDTYAGATPVVVGQTINQSTLEATSDAFEQSLNEWCGAPVVEHGVWFTYSPPADGFVAFDASASTYGVGIMVFIGAPTPDGLWTCGPDRVAIDVYDGESYSVLAFGDGLTEETAGELVFSVEEAVPPPDVELAFDRQASVNRAGVIHLTGAIQCTSSDGSGQAFEVYGDVTQRVGRMLIRGWFDTVFEAPCDGTAYAWDAYVVGDNGIFAGGKAATVAFGVACTDFCSEGYASATVQLRRNGK